MERITRILLAVEYNKDSDILFATITPPEDSESTEVADDFFVRYNRQTGRPTGFECLDFSFHMQDDDWLKSLPDIGVFYREDLSAVKMTLRELLQHVWSGRDVYELQAEMSLTA